jgi:rhodanese-related sulfurtransferase
MANIEGRVAGENAACGNRAEFYGTIGTGICKIFDYAAGITGLSEKAARAAGFSDIVTSISAGGDKPFFMNAKSVITKVAADNRTGRIIGVQCVGDGDIAKELSLWSTAIKGGLTIDDMTGADLPYAPPFSPALGMSVIAAEVTQNKRRGLFTGIAAAEVKNRIDAGERLFMLDVRSAGEFRDLRLGIGEVLIPLDELRRRIDEIPSDRDAEIICYCKVAQRGYEASRILRGTGWTNVKVMEGGINAWPYGYIEKGGSAPVT